ncbi:dihydroneopterin aldolase [Sphingobacterium corticibacter]|uniref:7,8-dihydroneopterin aldolase n=1 Tax=Sphingobacterium corticibacter TaxID=2171749 RepID=A0A2T8HGL5_9SPHI|nr:dihydroneopterin aldolase [Sphingobacterium corticibacter]PVH24575.1 dihydroneopterin aldolase [Sphingobacterium corticibacter]
MATITQEVAIKDARFFSPIGFYPEEQVLGNEFYVDVSVSFPFANPNAERLENTINYEELYQIMVEVMAPKRELLESAAEDILNRLLERYATLEQIAVRIRKQNPPFGGDVSQSVVGLTYQR